MNLEITQTYDGRMPQVQLPHNSLLSELGEEGIRKLISRHYDLLIKSEIKDMFPQQEEALKYAKQKSSDFIIQILGGKPYYQERRGNPMLRKRHMPFPIDKNARNVWLACYKEALLETKASDNSLLSFWNYIDKFSLWMINR